MCLYRERKENLKNCEKVFKNENIFTKNIANYNCFEDLQRFYNLENMNYIEYREYISNAERILTNEIDNSMELADISKEIFSKNCLFISSCSREVYGRQAKNEGIKDIEDKLQVECFVMRYLLENVKNIKQTLEIKNDEKMIEQ